MDIHTPPPATSPSLLRPRPTSSVSRLDLPAGRATRPAPSPFPGFLGSGPGGSQGGSGLARGWASRASPAAPTSPRPQAGLWRPPGSARLGRDASERAASLGAFSLEGYGAGAEVGALFTPKVLGGATAPTTYQSAASISEDRKSSLPKPPTPPKK